MSEKKKSVRIKVSIVEDNRGTRESLTELLGRAGMLSCVGAHSSGEEALAKIPLEQPDVVLMDINLPRMNGMNALPASNSLFPKPRCSCSPLMRKAI